MHLRKDTMTSMWTKRPEDTSSFTKTGFDWSEGDIVPASTQLMFPPFKFEQRRTRIDWRLLHGVDSNTVIRDTDVDTLEKCVHVLAYGDIEAEDTLHLTEINFIKIFRLSQLTIEYLLYVQDCLSRHNEQLIKQLSLEAKSAHVLRARAREQHMQLKHAKRELRRACRTNRYYELLFEENQQRQTTLLQTQMAGTMPGTGGHLGSTANMTKQFNNTTPDLQTTLHMKPTTIPGWDNNLQHTTVHTVIPQAPADDAELQDLQQQLARALQLVQNYDMQQKELVTLAQQLVHQQQQQRQSQALSQTTEADAPQPQDSDPSAVRPSSPVYEWDNRDEVVQQQQEELAELNEELRKRSHVNTELMLQVQKTKREMERLQHENRCFKIVLDAKDNGQFTTKVDAVLAEMEAARQLAENVSNQPRRLLQLEQELEQTRAECMGLHQHAEQMGTELMAAVHQQKAEEDERVKCQHVIEEQNEEISRLTGIIDQLNRNHAATISSRAGDDHNSEKRGLRAKEEEEGVGNKDEDEVPVIRVSVKRREPSEAQEAAGPEGVAAEKQPQESGAEANTEMREHVRQLENQLEEVLEDREQLREQAAMLQREVQEMEELNSYLQRELEQARQDAATAATAARAGGRDHHQPAGRSLSQSTTPPRSRPESSPKPERQPLSRTGSGGRTPSKDIVSSPVPKRIPASSQPYEDRSFSAGPSQQADVGREKKVEPYEPSDELPLAPHHSSLSYSSTAAAPSSLPSVAKRNLQQKARELDPLHLQEQLEQLEHYQWDPTEPSQQVKSILNTFFPYGIPTNPAVLSSRPTSSVARNDWEQALRQVQEDINSELWTYGVDPNPGELTDAEYVVAMNMLRQQQVDEEEGHPPATQKIIRQLRAALAHHLRQHAKDGNDSTPPGIPSTTPATQQPSPMTTPDGGTSPERRRSRLEAVSRPETPVSPLRQGLQSYTASSLPSSRSPAPQVTPPYIRNQPYRSAEDGGVPEQHPHVDTERDSTYNPDEGFHQYQYHEPERAQYHAMRNAGTGPDGAARSGHPDSRPPTAGSSPLRAQLVNLLPDRQQPGASSSRLAPPSSQAQHSTGPQARRTPSTERWQRSGHDGDADNMQKQAGYYKQQGGNDGQGQDGEDTDIIEEFDDKEEADNDGYGDDDANNDKKNDDDDDGNIDGTVQRLVVNRRGKNDGSSKEGKDTDGHGPLKRLSSGPTSGGWAKDTLPTDLVEEDSVDVESIKSFGSGASSPGMGGGWVAETSRKPGASSPRSHIATPPKLTPIQHGIGDRPGAKRPDSAVPAPKGGIRRTHSSQPAYDYEDDFDSDSLDFMQA